MSGYRRVNYYELCRLCTSSEGTKMNIFLEEGRRRQLQTKIQNCLPVSVLEEDSLPKTVCVDCIKKLDSYLEFREAVVNAESMLESYFTSLRFSEDFLKEGKVYVKTTVKEEKPIASEEQCNDPPTDPLSIKVVEQHIVPTTSPQIIADQTQNHPQQVLVSNINASNLQIISGVQAHVQQYKCAMQMQSGNVAAAVVEATAETHYSYQQQTSQQMQPQQNQTQNQILEHKQPQQSQSTQIQVQNQMQSQNQMTQQQQQQVQTLRQIPQQPSNQASQSNPQQIHAVNQEQSNQHQSQINQQLQQLQRQHQEQIEKQRRIIQIDNKHHHHQQQQQQHQQQQQQQHQHIHVAAAQEQHQLQQQQVEVHRSNIILKTENIHEQQSLQPEKKEAVMVNQQQQQQQQQTFTTVQATPEVLLSLGFKDALAAQVTRDDVKDIKEFVKNQEDVLSRNSISHISEFLRIRSGPEQTQLVTVNPQAITQAIPRSLACIECGKTFNSFNQMNGHDCTANLLTEQIREMTGANNVEVAVNPAATSARVSSVSKEESSPQANGNGASPFSCDVCNKPFKRKEHLFQHRKLHTGERPYVCTTCAKAFSRKEHLVRHLVSHTGQKMHECEMCGKSFSRKDNLHKHRKTHGTLGPHVCKTCGKSFVVKHYYLMHLTTHAPAAVDGLNCAQDPLPYKCDICHKAFSVKQYLTTHKLRHRSKNSSNSAQNSNSNNGQQTQPQQQQQQQQQQQIQQAAASGEISITRDITAASMSNGTGQAGNNSVIEIQGVIDRADQQQQQQQGDAFTSNNFQGNVTQFQ